MLRGGLAWLRVDEHVAAAANRCERWSTRGAIPWLATLEAEGGLGHRVVIPPESAGEGPVGWALVHKCTTWPQFV